MIRRLSVSDARQKINRNSGDARQKLKTRQQNQNSNVRDARFKIRAKKFQPLKQEMIKINSRSSGLSKPKAKKAALPGRTITNSSTLYSRQHTMSKQKPASKTSSMSGFISVQGGERKLMEKVTLHQTGMKIAIRNDFASSKSSTSDSTKNDQPLKITLSNPHAVKKPASQSSRPLAFQHHPSVGRQERFRRKLEYRPYPPVRQPPVHPRSSSRSSSASHPSSGGYAPPIAMHHHISPIGIRPMASYQPTYDMVPQNQQMSATVSAFSPFEGTKILVSNLHPVVVEDDILELFSVVGAVRRARMVGPGTAEVVFVQREDAIHAYQKYNNRDLDGQPMIMKLLLSDDRTMIKPSYSWMKDIGTRKNRGTLEIEPTLLQKSLFKSPGITTAPVVFTVKI